MFQKEFTFNEYVIALGSNLGHRKEFILKAIELMKQREIIVEKLSPLYETEPIGNADQSFLNAAARCKSKLTPSELLDNLLSIEKKLGRVRTVHWGNRSIDLDIILWRDIDGQFKSYSSDRLTIPHCRCLERDFVMIPVLDVAKDWKLPDQNLTVAEIVEKLGYKLPPPSSKIFISC